MDLHLQQNNNDNDHRLIHNSEGSISMSVHSDPLFTIKTIASYVILHREPKLSR